LQNDRSQNFVEHIITVNYRGSRCLVVDIDLDNDLDILSSSHYLGDISLWTNNILTAINNDLNGKDVAGLSLYVVTFSLLVLNVRRKNQCKN
jgi:hypothetical protein